MPPRLSAIASDRLDTPRVDVNAVSRTALGAHVLTEAPLDALHHSATDHGEFDLASLGHLENDALVLLLAYGLAEAADSPTLTGRTVQSGCRAHSGFFGCTF